MSSAEAAGPAEDSIKVVCRFRPLNKSELASGSQYIPKFKDDNCVSVSGKSYVFDKVFGSNTPQETFYEGAAKTLVKDVLCGYNGTIFAYGQTSSGKTHTMEGVMGDPNLQGIIPRIVQDIFNHIYSVDENLVFHLKCSYFEIYLDRITDLLDVTKVNLSVHEDKNRIPFVKGATERFVSSPEEVLAVIQEGKSNRHITATNMNAESSRSHSVFLIDINQEHAESQKKLSGKLYLVDLAGSEKVGKTGAAGVVLDEAKNINKSLSALGNVISSLADGVKSHIPYRDSKLTRILQESLGGNARTTIIICCSPASFNEAETKSTLDFGKRAKTIKNAVRVNEELTAEEWKRRYNKEREKAKLLRKKLSGAEKELEKWRHGETVSAEEQISLKEEEDAPPTTENRRSKLLEPTQLLIRENSSDLLNLERKQENFYKQLDEKDEELTQQCILVEQLKEQLAQQEELLLTSQKDYQVLQLEMAKLETASEAATDEVQGVLEALEELALSYDEKVTEVEEKVRELDKARTELGEKTVQLNSTMTELQQIRDKNNNTNKLFSKVIRELNEIDRVINVPPLVVLDENDFESTPLLISRINFEVNSLVIRCRNQESTPNPQNKESFYEDNRNFPRGSPKDNQFSSPEFKYGNKEMKHEDNRNFLRGSPMDNQFTPHEPKYGNKENKHEDNRNFMTDSVSAQNGVTAFQAQRRTLEMVRPNTILQNDTDGLQNKVSKELQTLLNLRMMFVSTMKNRLHMDINKLEANDKEDTDGSLAQKENIKILEENLEHLTKNYKMLVRDNSDLRCAILKTQKYLQIVRERVKVLEVALRAAREKCIRDRKFYVVQLDRMKEEAVCRKWKSMVGRRYSQAQIAKPIVTGHSHS